MTQETQKGIIDWLKPKSFKELLTILFYGFVLIKFGFNGKEVYDIWKPLPENAKTAAEQARKAADNTTQLLADKAFYQSSNTLLRDSLNFEKELNYQLMHH